MAVLCFESVSAITKMKQQREVDEAAHAHSILHSGKGLHGGAYTHDTGDRARSAWYRGRRPSMSRLALAAL